MTMTAAELRALPPDRKAPFDGVFLVRRVNRKVSRNDSTFLNIELGDNSGSFSFNCFDGSPAFTFFAEAAEGVAVRIAGRTGFWQGRFSPDVDDVTPLTDEELAEGDLLSQLTTVAPIPPAELRAEINAVVAELTPTPLRATVERALADMGAAFEEVAAAVAMHHAYRHGLLEHTTRMLRAARATLPLYPEVDASLALAGIILHDAGKTLEYTNSLVTRRTRLGLLQGHVVLGYRVVRKAALQAGLDADRRERLEHIILSHQGEPEWGAAVRAATPEAVFVSLIDNLDAKMGMVQHSLRTAPEGAEFSDFLPGLQASLLLTPLPGATSDDATAEPDLFSQLAPTEPAEPPQEPDV